MNLLRRFFGGCAEVGGRYCGGTGGGAVIVGAGAPTVGPGAATVGPNNCFPQLRQKLSPGVAMVPHCGQTVAFNVGSLIPGILDRLCCTGLPAQIYSGGNQYRRKCFYL